MADLHPIPFSDLVRRMRAEVEAVDSIFDLPVRKWYIPDSRVDVSAVHFSRRAGTPVGPAAGPHTQLAQNIVLAWLAGGRIMELKTVQVQDRLTIPRPCIHIPNIGYNVEWSQELRVEDSLLEYAKAAYLIEILKATRGFGRFPTDHGLETVFDMSVGYDLEGVRSSKVVRFVRGMQHPGRIFDDLRAQLEGDLGEFRDTELPSAISGCVTLSTFHGCPAGQIESITRFLLEELDLHVILKLNPTLLGFEEVTDLLVGRMGYESLTLRPEAFDVDLQYRDGLEIFRSLRDPARARGTVVGAKFTNTLVVQNDPGIFPTQEDPYMYVSGPPLHVIAMTLMQRFRDDLGFEIPVSFSAGIDARNVSSAVACGMVPVTTCTDLLRQGGFGRLPGYLRALGREMDQLGVASREAYVLTAGGNGREAAEAAVRAQERGPELWRTHGERLGSIADGEPDALPAALREIARAEALDGEALVLHATRVAGRLNGRTLVGGLADEERYHAAHNEKPPRRIDSVLGRYDCINCDLCVSACPNDAIFVFHAGPVEEPTEYLSVASDGRLVKRPGAGFAIETDHQLAVFDGACNWCSNCEVYCPEEGAPFRIKERFFPTRARYEASRSDGFFLEGATLLARIEGREHRLDVAVDRNLARLRAEGIEVEMTWEPLQIADVALEARGPPFDTAMLWRMKAVWSGVYHSGRPNPVNAEGR
jgi:putative selenate reductase